MLNFEETSEGTTLKCQRCKQKKLFTKENFRFYKGGKLRDDICRICVQEEKKDTSRQYAINRAETLRETSKQWNLNNKFKILVRVHNQRALAKGLPAYLTPDQWEACLVYWKSCCAVCGKGADEEHGIGLALDRWVPLEPYYSLAEENPGNVAWNVLPLCTAAMKSARGCNLTKSGRDPVKWLSNILNEEEAAVKLLEIQKYFELVKSSPVEFKLDHSRLTKAEAQRVWDLLIWEKVPPEIIKQVTSVSGFTLSGIQFGTKYMNIDRVFPPNKRKNYSKISEAQEQSLQRALQNIYSDCS